MSEISPNHAAQPFPAGLVEQWQTRRGAVVTIRAIGPADADIEQQFVRGLSDESRFHRFFDIIKELSPAQLIRFTRIDFNREMALIAVHCAAGRETEIAVARYVTNKDGRSCEFAVVVADDWRRHGLATKLMQKLIECARAAGLEIMEGEVQADNHAMLELVKGLGFKVGANPDDPTLRHVACGLARVAAHGG
jgi:acetyltransferase